MSNEEIALGLKRRLETLPKPSHRSQMKRLLWLTFTVIGQHPSIYAYAVRLPFLGIGETYFKPDFPMMQWGEWQAQLGLRLWPRWREMGEVRKRNATFWREWLRAHPELGEIPQTDGTMDISYLRMPVLCKRRTDAMEWFRKQGIHAQKMYPASLADVSDPRLRTKVYSSIEDARFLAEALYTLPVHPLFDAERWCIRHNGVGPVCQGGSRHCRHRFVIM